MSLLSDVRADATALQASLLRAALVNRGWQALALYRVAHRLSARRVPLLPLLLTRLVQILYGIDLDWRARIAPGVVIRHGFGIVIGENARVGAETTIFHGVTLGYTGDPARGGFPTVGERVLLGAGCVVLGRITVGDGAKVGANAVVLHDVPPGATAVGNPARVL